MKTSNNPKVLMLSIGYGGFGGTELGAERLHNWLEDNGVDVVVIASGRSKDIMRVPTFGVWRVFWPLFAYIISVAYACFRDFDVIYARYATYPLFVGVVLKYISGKPLVVSIHGGDIRHGVPLSWLINAFLRRADKVVCYDNIGHINELKRRGIDPLMIPNGVDTRLFKLRKAKSNKNKIIYAGGTRDIKGWFDIISVVNDEVLCRRKDIEFHIYGDGSIGSDDVIFFHSKVAHSDMPSILETGQLFILPSKAEGVPTALLEAMASGMFVIASDLDYTRTVFDKKFLFKPGDVGRMRELIVRFCDDRVGYFKGQDVNNRKIVLNKYSMDVVWQKWKELFICLAKRG